MNNVSAYAPQLAGAWLRRHTDTIGLPVDVDTTNPLVAPRLAVEPVRAT